MKALLLKELYGVKKNLKGYLLLIIALSTMSIPTSVSFVTIIGAYITICAISYDERSYFNKLSKVYPYSNLSNVFSKYIVGYVWMVLSLIYVVVFQTLFFGFYSIDMIYISLLIGILCMSIILPFVFKFGSEKGVLALMLSIFSIGVIAKPLSSYIDLTTIMNKLNTVTMSLFVLITAIISVFISMKINDNKST